MPAPPRRLLTRALLAAVLGLTAAFAVACGSGGGSDKGLLSAAQSRTISSALGSISSAVHAHSCTRAKAAVDALDRSLQDLPAGTNQKLVRNLGHGASTVSQLALTQCRPAPSTKTTTSPVTTTTTTTTQPATTTQSVPTTQSAPTTPSTPQTTPETTPSTPTPTPTTGAGAGGNGNGNGNGGAGGGAGLTGGGSQ